MVAIQDVVTELAVKQHGVVTRKQLLLAGVTAARIDGALRNRLLRSLHAGVYQAGPLAGPCVREMAAALACHGTVSHRSAAIMRQLTLPRADSVDVTIPSRRRVERPGIRIHRCLLRRIDVGTIDGVPVTTLPRTVFDFAAIATTRELERALAVAERTDVKLHAKLNVLLDLHPNACGTARLRALLGRNRPSLTRSEAEERLLMLIRSAGLPVPEMNVLVHGYEVDCFWRGEHLVVEVDGYAWHGSARAFLNDRQRDTALAAAGIQVIRLTWQQLTEHRDRTLIQLALAIARGHAGTRP